MTDLYTLTVAFNSEAPSFTFNFKTFKDAHDAYERVRNARAAAAAKVAPYHELVEIRDDYGACYSVDPVSLGIIGISTPAQAIEASAAMEMIKARAQAKFAAQAKSDPTLRLIGNALHGQPQ